MPWGPPEYVLSCSSELLEGYSSPNDLESLKGLPDTITKKLRRRFSSIEQIRIVRGKERTNYLFLVGVSLAYIESLKYDNEAMNLFYER